VCERCFAVYRDQTWRAAGPARRVPAEVTWTLCPSCSQVERQEYFGRVRVNGTLARERESEVRRRIWNVERRARATQPERRLVNLGKTRGGLEVLTTSQKLAHRIARELEKAFGGRASYTWAERDGLLEATWDPKGRRRGTTPKTPRHGGG
jgi:NMD protein affecting ribosome stability and mRNA decay